MTQTSTQPPVGDALERVMGVRALTASAFNMTVGSGIFVLPAAVAAMIGGAAPVAYLICAVAMALVVLCFAEAGSRVSRTGGTYAYATAAFGPFVGALTGALLYAGAGAIASAAVMNVFVGTLTVLAPSVGTPVVRVTVMALAYGGLALLNIRGSKPGVRAVEVFSLGKLIPLLGLVAIGAIAWALRPTPPPTVTRLAATLPPGDRVAPLLNHALALSPDGSQIAFVAIREGRKPQIYLRALDSNDSRSLPGTEGAENLFFSPDGKWLGFVANRTLMKVALGGGVPIPICAAISPRGASWDDNGTIVFAPNFGTNGLFQVPERGGAPTKIVTKRIVTKTPSAGEGTDATREQALRWPQLLPGGQAVLFTVWSREQDSSQVVVERLDTHTRPVTVPGGTSARYVRSGHIVYARGAVLWAVPFDVGRLNVTGEPVPVADGVALTTQGAAQFDLSRTGSLVYVPGDAKGPAKKLVWVDRAGGQVPLAADAGNYKFPRLSPNARQVAVTIQNEHGDDIWVWDITNERLYPLTSQGESTIPQWTHKDKGERIVFRSKRNGVWALFSTLANGGGDEQQVTPGKTGNSYLPYVVSPDDEVVEAEVATRSVWIIPMTGDRTPRLLMQSSQTSARGPGVFGEGGSFSSDGRWVASVSDATGRPEIYVRSFPDGKDVRQISTEGGVSPRFARSGPIEEIYYQHDDQMMAVQLTITTRSIGVGRLRELFTGPFEPGFDVTRDGQRFLMMLANEKQAATQVNVVLNWFEDVKRRVAPATKK